MIQCRFTRSDGVDLLTYPFEAAIAQLENFLQNTTKFRNNSQSERPSPQGEGRCEVIVRARLR